VKRTKNLIKTFGLQPGNVIAGKYEIQNRLGSGWEGEVYLIRETTTGIERTAKFFFPHRNQRNRSLKFYARKLHKLRHCPIVLQYHTLDTCEFEFKGIGRQNIGFLVSEFVEGEILTDFLKRRRGNRITPYMGVHLLHALAEGIENIHTMGEYHGDLHSDNIIVQRYGLGFDIKLLDMFDWQAPKTANIHFDVICLIRILYDALGGERQYRHLPDEIKAICCGLKQSLIIKKFRSAGHLRAYLENMHWS
jgi:serine/threonine protein kinase